MLLVVEQLSRDVVIGYETLKVNGALRSVLYHVITIVLLFSQNCRFFSVILLLSVLLEFVEKSFVRPFKSTKPPVDGWSTTTTPNYKNDILSAIKTIPHKRTNRTSEQHPLGAKKKQTRFRDKLKETINDANGTTNRSGMFLPIPRRDWKTSNVLQI